MCVSEFEGPDLSERLRIVRFCCDMKKLRDFGEFLESLILEKARDYLKFDKFSMLGFWRIEDNAGLKIVWGFDSTVIVVIDGIKNILQQGLKG